MKFLKNISEDQKDKILALDCEMCGNTRPREERHLEKRYVLKATLIDGHGNIIFDELCIPEKTDEDMKTDIHGITKQDLQGKQSYLDLIEKVKVLVKDKIVVGHSLDADLKGLGYNKTEKKRIPFEHPFKLQRDTAERFQWTTGKKRPSLKELAKNHIGVTIQEGIHDSKEDAFAALLIYAKYYDSWEISLKKKFSMPFHCELCNVFCKSKKVLRSHLNGKKHQHNALLAGSDESSSDSNE
ncbi:Oidioi.mRNA.OKI2018_I69.chr2.g4262.t1.cds [Oikopleura dioica]|uniref:Oidioi.mRNA.OKI2018_I69.chr2.g4262.t1.cds n=1 Tax=Oikopleura dioica TaxID=34765 RepID=A0ABN7T0M4_OIKDI|nr:Oidioi.mRNA.OKI2018_I69.chr2.g4262.t1.cds [Oikopleura dioica]